MPTDTVLNEKSCHGMHTEMTIAMKEKNPGKTGRELQNASHCAREETVGDFCFVFYISCSALLLSKLRN